MRRSRAISLRRSWTECFELAYHYKHVDEVFKRLGLEK